MRWVLTLGLLATCGCTAGQVRSSRDLAGAVTPAVSLAAPDVAPIAGAIRDGFRAAADAVEHQDDDEPVESWAALAGAVVSAIAGSWVLARRADKQLDHERDERRVARGESVTAKETTS